MTLESKAELLTSFIEGKVTDEMVSFIETEKVRLAVDELKELLRKKAFHSLTDDIYTPETDDDVFLYLPEIYKTIDEVLGFTEELKP